MEGMHMHEKWMTFCDVCLFVFMYHKQTNSINNAPARHPAMSALPNLCHKATLCGAKMM
jgi:hypothetical protein